MSTPPSPAAQHNITLIGLGTIGVSFAALHLKHTNAIVSVYDTRPDLEEYINTVLPGSIDSPDPTLTLPHLLHTGRLKLCPSLESACQHATIVQEQGPENLPFKRALWPQIEALVSATTHLWSSTSGIPASHQVEDMKDQTRLLVVHPFNPPHIMPLIELVPSPTTHPAEVDFARSYFAAMPSGHQPIVLNKEVPGFVGNRLAFALLREACSLVDQDVISAQDLDLLVESSIGPRWAVQGPFKSYNMGGGAGGLGVFLKHLAGTVQGVWNTTVPLNFTNRYGQGGGGGGWEDKIVAQVDEAYGSPNPAQYAARDAALNGVLEVQRKMRDDAGENVLTSN